MNQQEREEGYYWIKANISSHWEPLYWDGKNWCRNGVPKKGLSFYKIGAQISTPSIFGKEEKKVEGEWTWLTRGSGYFQITNKERDVILEGQTTSPPNEKAAIIAQEIVDKLNGLK